MVLFSGNLELKNLIFSHDLKKQGLGLVFLELFEFGFNPKLQHLKSLNYAFKIKKFLGYIWGFEDRF